MKILMLVDNYPPEMNANARIFSELAELLADQNFRMSVITSHPNFPKGKIFPGHKNTWRSKRTENRVHIARVKTYMHPNQGRMRRALDFFSFGCSSFFCGLFEKNVDCMIGVTPQFFCALSACFLSIIKRKPFIMVLCDLWPDSVVSNKMISKGFSFSILKRLEFFMYRRSSAITILSPCFRSYLVQNKIDNTKIVDFISAPNEGFYPRDGGKKEALLLKYNLRNKLVIGYIGTFGISHNHEDIIHIFKRLKRKDIHLLMIGDGAKRESISNLIKTDQLSNVTMDGPIPAKEVPLYWSVCDVAIVPLAPTETNKTVIPSKILESMKIGLPAILYTPQGEATRFFAKSEAFWHVESGSIEQLNTLINSLSKESIAEKKEKALAFSKKFSRKNQANILRDTLYTACKREKNFDTI